MNHSFDELDDDDSCYMVVVRQNSGRYDFVSKGLNSDDEVSFEQETKAQEMAIQMAKRCPGIAYAVVAVKHVYTWGGLKKVSL